MSGKFPYKVFNDLTAKLKAAQEETKIAEAEIQSLQSINLAKEKDKQEMVAKFPYNAIWYSDYKEDTTAANAQIQFLQSIKTGLTVHNASLSDKVGNLTREKVKLMQQNSSLTTKVQDLTRKEAELDTTLSNLSRERDELQQQNTYLTSRLNNLTKENAALTHENNNYHLKLALTNCEDPLATPTP